MEYSCNGIKQTDKNICSGHGICIQLDQCKCFDGWKGENCDKIDYELIYSKTKLTGQEKQHYLEKNFFENIYLQPEETCYCLMLTAGHCTGKTLTARKYAYLLNNFTCQGSLDEINNCQKENGLFEITGSEINENNSQRIYQEFNDMNINSRKKKIYTIFLLDEIQTTSNMKSVENLILKILNRKEKIIVIGIINFYIFKDVSKETLETWELLLKISKDYSNNLFDSQEYKKLKDALSNGISTYILDKNHNQMVSKCLFVPYFHYNKKYLSLILKERIENIIHSKKWELTNQISDRITNLFLNYIRELNYDVDGIIIDARPIFYEFKIIENNLLKYINKCHKKIEITILYRGYSIKCEFEKEKTEIIFESKSFEKSNSIKKSDIDTINIPILIAIISAIIGLILYIKLFKK